MSLPDLRNHVEHPINHHRVAQAGVSLFVWAAWIGVGAFCLSLAFNASSTVPGILYSVGFASSLVPIVFSSVIIEEFRDARKGIARDFMGEPIN
jgi:hypothetical protein